MTLATAGSPGSSYRVEISGWDNSDVFFVERSELEWSGEASKRVRLSHDLVDSSIVFVRLLQNTNAHSVHAVAYRVESIRTTEDGRHEFCLKPALDLAGVSAAAS